MKIKALAKKINVTEEELIYAFSSLGYVKPDGTPYSKFVKNGMFTSSGEYNYKKDFAEMFDEELLPSINSAIASKQIEDLKDMISDLQVRQEEQDEIIEELREQIEESISNKNKKKKEKKPRNVDMSSRARSLIGKTINGWSITGDKLDVVATKPGSDDIRISGMKKKEDLMEMLV